MNTVAVTFNTATRRGGSRSPAPPALTSTPPARREPTRAQQRQHPPSSQALIVGAGDDQSVHGCGNRLTSRITDPTADIAGGGSSQIPAVRQPASPPRAPGQYSWRVPRASSPTTMVDRADPAARIIRPLLRRQRRRRQGALRAGGATGGGARRRRRPSVVRPTPRYASTSRALRARHPSRASAPEGGGRAEVDATERWSADDLGDHLHDAAGSPKVLREVTDREVLSFQPAVKRSPRPPASRAGARESRTCTRGRHADPSLSKRMRPVVWLHAARLLSTMSRRRRGETPNTVAFRIETGAKSGPASSTRPSSERTFDSAYGVSGFSGASSSTAASVSDAPYIEQDEANTNRRTPASRRRGRAGAASLISAVNPASGRRADRSSRRKHASNPRVRRARPRTSRGTTRPVRPPPSRSPE